MKLRHCRGQKGHGFAGPGTEREKPLEMLTFRCRRICVSSLQNSGPCKSLNKDLILSAQCYSSLRLWGGGWAYGEAVRWVNATCVIQRGPTGRKAIVELYGIYHEMYTFVQLEYSLCIFPHTGFWAQGTWRRVHVDMSTDHGGNSTHQRMAPLMSGTDGSCQTSRPLPSPALGGRRHHGNTHCRHECVHVAVWELLLRSFCRSGTARVVVRGIDNWKRVFAVWWASSSLSLLFLLHPPPIYYSPSLLRTLCSPGITIGTRLIYDCPSLPLDLGFGLFSFLNLFTSFLPLTSLRFSWPLALWGRTQLLRTKDSFIHSSRLRVIRCVPSLLTHRYFHIYTELWLNLRN